MGIVEGWRVLFLLPLSSFLVLWEDPLVYMWAFPGFFFFMNIFLALLIKKKKKKGFCWTDVNMKNATSGREQLPKEAFGNRP